MLDCYLVAVPLGVPLRQQLQPGFNPQLRPLDMVMVNNRPVAILICPVIPAPIVGNLEAFSTQSVESFLACACDAGGEV